MTSRSVLSWDNLSERGIFTSGWSPCQSGDFSFDVSDGSVVAIYEDLRPGPTACTLFSLPPLIAFAPLCCPMLSMTSRAFLWQFEYNSKTQMYDCLFRQKSFFAEEIHTFHGVHNIRLESKQKAHTESDVHGGTKTQSIVVHQVFMEHELGSYEFPADIPHGFKLQSFVNSVHRLLGSSSTEGNHTDDENGVLQIYPCAYECPTDIRTPSEFSKIHSSHSQGIEESTCLAVAEVVRPVFISVNSTHNNDPADSQFIEHDV